MSTEVTVLVADDNLADVRMLRYGFLTAEVHCRVHQVTTGVAARLWLAESKAPALVVLDMRLPDESGLAILQAMKADSRLKLVPAMVLSGMILEEDRIRITGCGDLCATKPFDIDGWTDLARRIEAIWSGSQASLIAAA